jgi:hypothetical protein
MYALVRRCLIVCMTGLPLPVMAGHCDAGGIGGTGVISEPSGDISETFSPEDGIGGTGVDVQNGIGGTGIVSEITGFNSICVNSLAMHYWTSATSADDSLLQQTQLQDLDQITQ